jgi:hypothetical protein
MKNIIKAIFTKKTRAWLKAAVIRAARTFFQTFGSLMTVGALISEITWGMILSTSAVAFIYSMVTSLGGLPEESGETK